jgi:hypothetical protein
MRPQALLIVLWMVFIPVGVSGQSDIPPKILQQTPPLGSDHDPITKTERTNWLINSVIGPKSLVAGVVGAGWHTALNAPEEYGPHVSGFAKRYAMRFPSLITDNAIEAGLGSLWDEDPRYFRSGERAPWRRLRQAATMTVFAYRKDGSIAPAYGRYAGVVGSNFLSNTWGPRSQDSINSALTRVAMGFTGRFLGNVFDEFWSDVRNRMRRR